jgi:predicted ferric reductase
MTLAVATGSALWYLARATGFVALVLLTVSVVLGVTTAVRWQPARHPRFVIEYVHRDVTLLVMAFIGIHVATIVLDGYVPIGWTAAVVPFTSSYRALWLGLGAVALDLLLAVAITSWLRHRIGHSTWRLVHWLAYGSWFVAVVHSLGTGTDAWDPWALGITIGCSVAVLAAVAVRLDFARRHAGSVPLRVER